MNDHGPCSHSEVHHLMMEFAEEITQATVMTLMPAVDKGLLDGASAAMTTSRMIFASAMETGIRIGLMDPIGAQLLLDHLDSSATTMITGEMLDEANQVLANDARSLLEAVARLR